MKCRDLSPEKKYGALISVCWKVSNIIFQESGATPAICACQILQQKNFYHFLAKINIACFNFEFTNFLLDYVIFASLFSSGSEIYVVSDTQDWCNFLRSSGTFFAFLLKFNAVRSFMFKNRQIQYYINSLIKINIKIKNLYII